MPIYDYCCESCGFQKDVLQKISDPILTICPECNKETFRKQLTAAGFQLKGSGWYVTDFRDNKKVESNKKEATKAEISDTKPSESKNENVASHKGNEKKEASASSTKESIVPIKKMDTKKANNNPA